MVGRVVLAVCRKPQVLCMSASPSGLGFLTTWQLVVEEKSEEERRRERGKETEIGSQVETLTFLLPSLGRHIESFLSCSIGADNPKPLSIFKEREHKTLLLVGHIVRSTSRKR